MSDSTPCGCIETGDRAWAEHLGYQVFLWDAFGDGALGMMTKNPDRSASEEDLELWRQLAAAKVNCRVLRAYLWRSGRVGPPEMRPDYGKGFTAADVRRASPVQRRIARRGKA